jgi:hypothetical protein
MKCEKTTLKFLKEIVRLDWNRSIKAWLVTNSNDINVVKTKRAKPWMLKSNHLICNKTFAMFEGWIFSTFQLRDFEVKHEEILK